MAAGRSILRNFGRAFPGKPVGGVNGAGVTVTGQTFPAGGGIEIAWGASPIDPPATGWVAVTSDTAGNWSKVTTYPAAGTWYLWSRRANHPRVAECSGPVTVT